MKLRYLKEKVSIEFEIHKSKFIGLIFPLHTMEEKDDILRNLRLTYPKATHYCSASLYGQSQEQQTADDDGEPSRTAGIPILDVLKHYDVTNILCVVIRYYGGIKLGSGGLVRAYTKAASDVMKLAHFYHQAYVQSFEITFKYTHVNEIDHFLNDRAVIIKKDFTDVLCYQLYLKSTTHSIQEIFHLLISYQELEPKLLFIDE